MASDGYAEAVGAHYGEAELEGAILAALRDTGKDLTALTLDDLAPVDQFHTRGKAATLELAELAGIEAGQQVLDVGGGIGGAARTLAATFGCRVTVLDLTAAYCQVGAALTARMGLADRVTFEHGNALDLPFPAAAFDLVWTQHSSMNIADKARMYAEIHRVLRPGGRLAIHEILAGPEEPVLFPVPWARDPALSALLPPTAMQAVIAGAGFRRLTWADHSAAALPWFQARAASYAPPAVPPPLGIHLLLGADFPQMLHNFARNLAEARVVVIQAVFERV